MIKNKLLIIIFLIFALFTLSGCTNNATKNIENFYYVVSIGIDKGTEQEIKLSVQIATSSSGDSSDSAQSTTSNIYTVECSSINAGISIFDNFLSKKLSFSHCSAIIFSEEIAKQGIGKYVKTLSNNPEIRPTCNIIISNSKSLETLECISNSHEDFSAKLYEFIINSVDYTGYSINPQIGEFFYNLNSDIATPIATYAVLSDDTLQNSGIAAFKEDKFITDLCVLDALSYSLVTNQLNSCTISIDNPFLPNEKMDISVSQRKAPKIEISIVNNHPFIKIKSPLECSIKSASDSFEYESTKNLKILEESINSYLEEITLNFLYKISHDYDIDICNLKNTISSKYTTQSEFKKIHWEDIYKNSFFEVEIDSSLKYNGLFTQE